MSFTAEGRTICKSLCAVWYKIPMTIEEFLANVSFTRRFSILQNRNYEINNQMTTHFSILLHLEKINYTIVKPRPSIKKETPQ